MLSAALALVSGLAVPGTALAHGFAHAREALEAHHADHGHSHQSTAGVELTGADHDHVRINAHPGARVVWSIDIVVVAVAIAGIETGSASLFEYPVPDEVPRTEATSQRQPLPRSPPFAA